MAILTGLGIGLQVFKRKHRRRRSVMANQLKMATIQMILSLRAQRWSYRRIARELGLHRGDGGPARAAGRGKTGPIARRLS